MLAVWAADCAERNLPRGRATNDGSVVLWDLDKATRIATLPATPGSPNNAIQIGASSLLTTVGFADSGRTLSVVTGNSTVSVWDLTDPVRPVRAHVLTRHTNGAGRVVFAPDGTTLVGAAVNGTDSITLSRLR